MCFQQPRTGINHAASFRHGIRPTPAWPFGGRLGCSICGLACDPARRRRSRLWLRQADSFEATALGALRAARRAWRTEQACTHAGLPEHDPDTTLVVGHWTYLGSRYSPGAALLAAAVWHRRELEGRFVAEGSR
ncbi:hypothetical protein [Streptomyces sp. WG5]|uniref:hypothetical protein n=1 Tax=Streptomyces sp. WG5 TaxID=3417648 RepID=UPI003CF29089